MKWLKIIVMAKATFSTIVIWGFVFVVCLLVDFHSQLKTKSPTITTTTTAPLALFLKSIDNQGYGGSHLSIPWDPIAKATTQATNSALDSSCHYWLTHWYYLCRLVNWCLSRETVECGGTTFQRNPQLTTWYQAIFVQRWYPHTSSR